LDSSLLLGLSELQGFAVPGSGFREPGSGFKVQRFKGLKSSIVLVLVLDRFPIHKDDDEDDKDQIRPEYLNLRIPQL